MEASVWTRIATIFAGPFVNLMMGFLIALILVAYRGTDLPVIQMVSEDSAAEEAGSTVTSQPRLRSSWTMLCFAP